MIIKIKKTFTPKKSKGFLLSLLLQCLKYNITSFFIDEKLKLFYYRGLTKWKNERGFLIDTCKAGQDKYMSIVNYFLQD